MANGSEWSAVENCLGEGVGAGDLVAIEEKNVLMNGGIWSWEPLSTSLSYVLHRYEIPVLPSKHKSNTEILVT